MEQRFVIKGVQYEAGSEGLQLALQQIYNTNESPYCMCRPDGVQMYVAKYAAFVIKRLPETGKEHHPSCQAYELPPGESGLGELIGEAVIERSNDCVEMRVDFPLTRVPGRSVQRGAGSPPGEVQAARRAVSLRGLMHWLWDQAGFNRWYPSMKGRRNWATVRKYLLEQAKRIETKGTTLQSVLYLAEPFDKEEKAAQAERRRKALRALNCPMGDVQYRMMIVLGEFNDVQDSIVGRKILVKHMPDTPLLVDDDTWQRIQKNFKSIFEAKALDEPLRLIMAALIYAKRDQVYQVDRTGFMLATENWIPVEDASEVALVRRLTQEDRSFLKPLRYESTKFAAFPNVKLLDTGDEPTALDIESAMAEEKDRELKRKAIEQRAGDLWVWNVSQPMPSLPAKRLRGLARKEAPEAAVG
jgi:hypothetical protein